MKGVPMKAHFRALLVFVLAAIVVQSALAAGPTVLPEGEKLKDWRLGELKDLNGYFPFTPAESPQDWQQRAERVRRQLLVANGLWPMPTRTPLRAVVHGKIEKDNYTVEKVFFESYPGFFVTGNLYRPQGKEGKKPGILCPHGHWSNGRFYDAGESKIKKELETKAEKFADGGRSPLQARCAMLARLGCVVFHYDMIGYADSQQISFELAHRFAKQRPDFNGPESWGLFSPQAESHLQSIMGMQTYSSIRALDFLESLPDVDKSRLAVTGASGGGTQTFMVSALDPRVSVSVPAVMVSTAMQGGCTCENASLLRVETGNVEFAALFAPKPQLLIAADDWTREMQTKGFPQLLEHYKMLKAEDDVALVAQLQFPHNYNYVNRAAMYHWMNKHLKLGHEEPIVEGEYERLPAEQLTVWNDQHPKPSGGPEFERKLLAWMTEDTQKQLAAAAPKDEASLQKYREIVGPALDAVIGRGLPNHADIEYKQSVKNDEGDFLEMAGVLTYKVDSDRQEQLPLAFLYPKDWNKQVVIWIDPKGKAGMYEDGGPIIDPIKALLREGTTVIGVDLLQQGEFLPAGKPLEKTRRVKNPREAAAYTFGYNHSLFARRVHDILTVVSYVKNHGLSPDEVVVAGLGKQAGPLVAAARAQARGAIDRAAIDTGGFRFIQVDDLHDAMFLPGGAKYDDLPGMLAVAAPNALWLAGEGKTAPKLVAAAYQSAGKAKQFAYDNGKDETADAAVKWILKKE